MVSRPLSHGPTRFRKIRSAFPDFGSIKIRYISKTRPDGMDWMGVQHSIQFQLPCNESSPPARIDNPSRCQVAYLFPESDIEQVPAFSAQFQILHFCRTPEFASGFNGLLQDHFVKFRAVELKCRQACLMFRSNFGAACKAVTAIPVKPHSES